MTKNTKSIGLRRRALRAVRRAVRLLLSPVTGLAVGLVIGVVFVALFLPHSPDLHLAIVWGFGLTAAIIAPFISLPGYNNITIRADGVITLEGIRRAPTDLPAESVRAVVARGGPDFSGGRMLTWQYLSLRTSEKNHLVRLGKTRSPQLFSLLLQNCPNAVGIDFEGQLHLPGPPTGHAAGGWLAERRPAVAAALAGLARYNMAVGGGLIAASVIAFAIVFHWALSSVFTARRVWPPTFCLIAFFGWGLTRFCRGVAALGVRNHALKQIDKAMLNTDDLLGPDGRFKVISPNGQQRRP